MKPLKRYICLATVCFQCEAESAEEAEALALGSSSKDWNYTDWTVLDSQQYKLRAMD